MENILHLSFTDAGRFAIQDGQLVVPNGLEENLWIRNLQGEKDPLRSELMRLELALARASSALHCVIGRKGRPGPKAYVDRTSLFMECIKILTRNEGAFPQPVSWPTLPKTSQLRCWNSTLR